MTTLHMRRITTCTMWALMTLILAVATPVFAQGKLKVFILAGQSNMVGHANPHTIATLFNSVDARDKKLIELVFRKDGKNSKTILDEPFFPHIGVSISRNFWASR